MRSLALSALIILTVGGCATRTVDIRTLPADTPAANAVSADSAAVPANLKGGSDASVAVPGDEQSPPLFTPADAPPMTTYDPWERINRVTYRFNAHLDEAVLLPVANGYRRLPPPLRSGVHNFFDNLAEIDTIVNYALQWRLSLSAASLGRFAVNTTLGIAGLFDVATKLHLTAALTGFGSTLSVWGMHPGPYLVIPILGPSTLRDGVGFLGDYGLSYGINIADLYRGAQSWALGVVNAIDERASINFRYYSSGSPFEYETIRFLYVRKRLIEDAGLRKRDAPRSQNTSAPAGK